MPCTRCGECCGSESAYVCRTIEPTKESEDYEAFLEFTRPKMFVRVPDGLLVKTPCEHLRDGNVCGVYENRPSVCRDFRCEKAGGQAPPIRKYRVMKLEYRVMKLGNVYASREAWQRLSALRMPPKTAYKLLKYLKTVTAESEVVEQERVKLLREAAGVTNGDVNLQSGTPEHAVFVAKFGAFLETDCDLKPTDLKMDDLLAALNVTPLEGEQPNTLSAADLSVLESFFTT